MFDQALRLPEGLPRRCSHRCERAQGEQLELLEDLAAQGSYALRIEGRIQKWRRCAARRQKKHTIEAVVDRMASGPMPRSAWRNRRDRPALVRRARAARVSR